ncbi:MAG: SDR family oxidoreductase [Caldiserica bacterium]|nr:SDR family oxidoreductase [Caldisericota bacterium]
MIDCNELGTVPRLLQGRVCLVTGATRGIGAATAEALAGMGATVVATGRSAERGQDLVSGIRQRTGNEDVHFLRADLASMAEVRGLARTFMEHWHHLHVLVDNAGTVFPTRRTTVDGYEEVFAVNHLAPFLLTNLLLTALRSSAPSRIIVTSSYEHRRGRMYWDNLQGERFYFSQQAYAQSKLANLLFIYELAQRLEGSGVTVNAVNPGLVHTNICMDSGILIRTFKQLMDRISGLSPEQGADTGVWLASSPDVDGVSGRYFQRRRAVRSSRASYDVAFQRRLWHISEELTGLSAKLDV